MTSRQRRELGYELKDRVRYVDDYGNARFAYVELAPVEWIDGMEKRDVACFFCIAAGLEFARDLPFDELRDRTRRKQRKRRRVAPTPPPAPEPEIFVELAAVQRRALGVEVGDRVRYDCVAMVPGEGIAVVRKADRRLAPGMTAKSVGILRWSDDLPGCGSEVHVSDLRPERDSSGDGE